MTEDEALEESSRILSGEITVETIKELEALEPYIADNKFGNLWEALYAAAPEEVFMAL